MSVETKTCPYCGNEIDINLMICPVCGGEDIPKDEETNNTDNSSKLNNIVRIFYLSQISLLITALCLSLVLVCYEIL